MDFCNPRQNGCPHLDLLSATPAQTPIRGPRRGAYILAKNLTMPVGYDAIEKRFRKIRTAAGAICNGLVMHGWRYTAAVELAEAGCSDAEIQSVTGHKTLAMVQKYRQRASQRSLSKQAQ
ncbi:tyrosine-type recombinase/integrase, partial [Pseudophaeobacter arcticus]|uniref:tyrosine-type recombinase/integrase n=1 Tax=Pseudophaeobacter arcticus TaxID=385492 RepID=UPI0033410DF8